ncbi:hypothetical protein D3C80_1892650 [compost metagenome]
MIGSLQHFENFAHDAPFLLDRLIGICIGADGDGPRLIIGLGELALQKARCIRLREQAGFEIETGRKPHVTMGRTGKAIDATVLATAIGIDRAVEIDVG